MSKQFLILFFLASISKLVTAQHTPFNSHFENYNYSLFPGRTGSNTGKVDVFFLAPEASVTNNSFNFKELDRILFKDDEDLYIDDLVESLKEENSLSISTELTILDLYFNITDSEENRLFSLGFHLKEKAHSDMQFSKNMARFIFQGNSQFAGENVRLGPFSTNFLLYHDLGVKLAVPVIIEDENKISLSAGAAVRYLIGVGSFQTERTDVNVLTEATGDFIQFTYDYDLSFAFPERSGDFLRGTGDGFAIDLGLHSSINDRATIDFSITDLGFIRFKDNAETYRKEGVFVYDGIDVDFWDNGNFEFVIEDTLKEGFDVESTGESYKVNLEPGLNLMGTLLLGESETRKGKEYYAHTLYMRYRQGFENRLDKTKKPEFALGYQYSLNHVLNVTPQFVFGGYTGFRPGLMLSVRGGAFKFSLGSSDLSPVFLKSRGKGVSFNLAFGLSF